MQRLLLVRHAIAEDILAPQLRDEARGLTVRGQQLFQRAARGLLKLVPCYDRLLVSPLRRTRQTGAILSRVYRQLRRAKQCDALAPEAPIDSIIHLLAGDRTATTLVCVGHAPNLAQLANALLRDRAQQVTAIKRGGACLLEFPRHIAADSARLVWLKTPYQLRTEGAPGNLPLCKRGTKGDFLSPAKRQIPPCPPFSKGGLTEKCRTCQKHPKCSPPSIWARIVFT